MKRTLTQYLAQWIIRSDRKPLLIRGARQVGKSYIVRDFAKQQGLSVLEINLEDRPELAEFILEPNPQVRRQLLEAHFRVSLSQIKPLLFLDELQSAPEVISRFRYLLEQEPSLPVIGAGSLLDFALNEHDFSMPVGRIETIFMGPMSFEEFLEAMGEKQLLEWISHYQWKDPYPEWIHSRLLELLRIYYLVGGMPEAVASFSSFADYDSVDRIQKNLLIVYQDDFSKYRKRVPLELLRRLFQAVPGGVGKKLVYSQIDSNHRSADVAKAFELLKLARVVYGVQHTSANGVPLASEASKKFQKPLFLDVGLLSSSLGLNLVEIARSPDFTLIHQGSVSEQFIGQHLLYLQPPYCPPELYCWVREKANSMAEVDYLTSRGTQVIPIEVKSGKSGKLKSLHVFILEKQVELGVRFCSEPPSLQKLKTSVAGTTPRSFQLATLPLYLVGQLRRLLPSIQ